MKKTKTTIFIILGLCIIVCTSVIGLVKYKNKTTTPVPPDTADIVMAIATPTSPDISHSTEQSTHAFSDFDSQESLLGSSIVQEAKTTEATSTDANQSSTTEFPECFDLDLEIISQYPELPAGCESVSLTMILNYYGYNLDKTDIAKNYLVYSNNFVMGYCGDPFSCTVGGGCYAPGMTITANKFFAATGNKHYAENITGTDFDVLLEYVAKGHPILIWSTIEMMSCSKSYWNVDDKGNGYAWDYNEHCVVLSGYDLKAGTVTIYDPISGIVYRDRKTFESIYEGMNKMAIIIREY